MTCVDIVLPRWRDVQNGCGASGTYKSARPDVSAVVFSPAETGYTKDLKRSAMMAVQFKAGSPV